MEHAGCGKRWLVLRKVNEQEREAANRNRPPITPGHNSFSRLYRIASNYLRQLDACSLLEPFRRTTQLIRSRCSRRPWRRRDEVFAKIRGPW